MSVSISEIEFWADWPNSRDTTFDVRAVSTQPWVTAEEEFVAAGASRVVGTGTITALRPTIPQIELPATSAGIDSQSARWTVTLHRTGKSEPLFTVLDNFPLNVGFEPAATWGEIRLFKNNGDNKIWRDTEGFSRTDALNLINSRLQETLVNASDVVKGNTYLTVPPASALLPKAVGDNDLRLPAAPAVVYADRYATLALAQAAAASYATATIVISTALSNSGTLTIPKTTTLEFTQAGLLTWTSGTLTVLGPVVAPERQIFGAGAGTVTLTGPSTLYPEWFGAAGDNSTDDAAAFNRCFAAALNGNSDKKVKLGAKVYVIGSALTAGSATRTIGLTIEGSGKYASRLRWTGNTSDYILTLLNIHYPCLRDFGVEGTTVAGGGIWYKVENGKSGSGPVTERVYISNVSVGMLIGGGDVLSSGQVNSGSHESVSFDSCVTGVKITGANCEVQSFHNLTMGGGAMTRGFHLLNGRGLFVKNADISLNTAGYHIPFFVELDGGSGYAHGGGFAFEDLRMEGMAGFFWAHIGNPALPLTLRLTNVSCASEPVGSSAPHDIIKLDTGNWSVRVSNSIFIAAQSRFSFLNLDQVRYMDFALEGCQINNGFGGTTPDDDPTVLLNVTRDTALSPAATGGLRAHLRGNLLTATSGVYQPVRQLKDRLVQATDLDISTATLNYLDIQDSKGKTLTQLIAGGAATTVAAGAGAGTSPTIAVAGKSMAGKVTLTTGTTPSASATVFTVTFPVAFASAPQVVLTPVGPNSAALSGNAQVYVDSASTSTTAFVVKVGSTNLVAATQYIWSYQVIQ